MSSGPCEDGTVAEKRRVGEDVKAWLMKRWEEQAVVDYHEGFPRG